VNGLIRNTSISILFATIALYGFGQYSTKKYIKRNRKAPTVVYGDSNMYARGICVNGDRLFVGNSDGSIYYINLQKKKQELIFKMPHIDEIRDIELYGDQLIAMHSGTNGKIITLKLDGSMHVISLPEWQGVFLDGIDIFEKQAFMMGDPVDGTFSLFRSANGGRDWEECPGRIEAEKGEAGFAASGSNVQVLNDSTFVFVSGGEKSRFFKSTDLGATWTDFTLPYYPGESTGAYTMCFANDSIGVIAGGDYRDPELSLNTCFYTVDGGESWLNAMNTVRGYRSCLYFVNGVFYACGRNGIDFSVNGGRDWTPFANGAYFSMTSLGDKLIATTKNGTIQIFNLIETE